LDANFVLYAFGDHNHLRRTQLSFEKVVFTEGVVSKVANEVSVQSERDQNET
jgi:hypothetical protein